MRLPRGIWAVDTHTNVTPASCITRRGQSPIGYRAKEEEKSQESITMHTRKHKSSDNFCDTILNFRLWKKIIHNAKYTRTHSVHLIVKFFNTPET